MLHEELKEQILKGKDLQAKQIFLEIVEQEYLWSNAFKGVQINSKYKKSILNWAFIFFCKKIREGKIGSIEMYSGVIVNTLREAEREYRIEIHLDLAEQINEEYADYIQGIDIFGVSENPLEKLIREETIEIAHRCFERMENPCRDLIRYKYIEELTHEEIVEKNIGFTTPSSSSSRLSQCMDVLRKMFNKESRR
jgi:hypothetical protein